MPLARLRLPLIVEAFHAPPAGEGMRSALSCAAIAREPPPRPAGIARSELAFDRPVATANGIVRMAPITLREVRIGQLSLDDVPAAVLANLRVLLFGMSLLGRLPNYQIRDGKLIIGW